MELTPEKFEKAEFAERRRGYDIDQVEAFLEETGTEFAQMLAKFRQTEKRAAAAEAEIEASTSKLSMLNQQLSQAVERAEQAESASRRLAAELQQAKDSVASGSPSRSDDEEVAQVAKALVMAQNAADSAVSEARAEAEQILDAARGKAERQLAQATNDADALILEARTRADREFSARREHALEEVAELDSRRAQTAQIISRMDERIDGYREDLRRAADQLVSIAEDPTLMGERESLSILPDEVISSDPTESTVSDAADSAVRTGGQTVDGEDAEEQIQRGSTERDETPSQLTIAEDDNDPGDGGGPRVGSDQTAEAVEENTLDLRSKGAGSAVNASAGTAANATAESTSTSDEETLGEWGPGSWSELAASLPSSEDTGDVLVGTGSTISTTAATASHSHIAGSASSTRSSGAGSSIDDRPTQAVDAARQPRDRYLEELDQAVNTDADADDEALAAFLEGSSDSKARRFGWRR